MVVTELLLFMISYLGMSLGGSFCMSRKVGQKELGGCAEGCKQHGHVWPLP